MSERIWRPFSDHECKKRVLQIVFEAFLLPMGLRGTNWICQTVTGKSERKQPGENRWKVDIS